MGSYSSLLIVTIGGNLCSNPLFLPRPSSPKFSSHLATPPTSFPYTFTSTSLPSHLRSPSHPRSPIPQFDVLFSDRNLAKLLSCARHVSATTGLLNTHSYRSVTPLHPLPPPLVSSLSVVKSPCRPGYAHTSELIDSRTTLPPLVPGSSTTSARVLIPLALHTALSLSTTTHTASHPPWLL